LGLSLSYSIILYQAIHGSVDTSVNAKLIKSKHLVKTLVRKSISYRALTATTKGAHF